MSDDAEVADYETGHWVGVDAVALVLIGLGAIVREPGLLLSGVVAATFAGYAGTARPPAVHGAGREPGTPAVTIERTTSDPAPRPGDEVTVTVRVENTGDRLLSDVRIVDGVPDELAVVEDSPRHATALRPGASTTFSYVVAAVRGEHVWRDARVVVSDPAGGVERETDVPAETRLHCRVRAIATEQLPLRALTTPYTGQVETDAGGAGLEFHSAREYQRGDPLRRIDWRRRARTGEFGTLQFREERTATVVLVVDARRAAYRTAGPDARSAVERSVEAATRLSETLLDEANRVGLAVYGPEEAWLAPGVGNEHRARVQYLLSTHPALSTAPPGEKLFETFREDRREQLLRKRIRELHGRLPDDAQIVLLSPCCDGYLPTVARRLDAYGHHVTVLAPDPTTRDTPGHHLARMEREDRLRDLRGAGLRVVDWPHGEPLERTLTRAQARWSR